jgi:hypothetical protein
MVEDILGLHALERQVPHDSVSVPYVACGASAKCDQIVQGTTTPFESVIIPGLCRRQRLPKT